MKAGVLGIVDGSFDVVDSYTDTVTTDEQELDRCLEIDRVFSLPSGDMAFAGRAAADARTERTTTTIEDGEIHVTERARTETKYTEFVGVPGEFVAVDGSDGTFAFDLVGAETDTSIERATLDLDEFFAARESATPWKAGFYGSVDGMNGVFHGEDLRASHDVDALLADSTLNQVGLSYEYDGADVKMTAARSGYVEVYRPSEFDSGQFLTYLREEIRPYVR